MDDIIKIFKALSERIRIRIILVLINAKKDLCVCEIVDALQETQYTVSRHLNILKNAGIIDAKRIGVWVSYFLKIEDNKFNQKLIEALKTLLKKDNEDIVRLKKRLKMRVGGKCVVGYKKIKR